MSSRKIILLLVGMIMLSIHRCNCRIMQADCSGRPELLELSRGHYPRYLTSLNCGPPSCLPLSCTPRIYRVKVLKMREIEDESPDDSLPETLRNSWKFVHLPVTVACVCTLYNQEKK